MHVITQENKTKYQLQRRAIGIYKCDLEQINNTYDVNSVYNKNSARGAWQSVDLDSEEEMENKKMEISIRFDQLVRSLTDIQYIEI